MKPLRASPSSFEAEIASVEAARDPAAHLVGRVELDQRLADIDREHVGRAEQGQHRQRQRIERREAEDDRRARRTPTTATSILTPTLVLSGRNEKKIAVSVAPTAGAARERAEPVGADLEDVARKDRQHRGRPAEQHREQIEA